MRIIKNMILLLLITKLILTYFEPLPECNGETCDLPYIYHNFTNCPPVLIKKSVEQVKCRGCPPFYQKECQNEGTWKCANFTANWPHPYDGYVKNGEIDFSFVKCCEHKNARWVETVVKVRHDLPPMRRSPKVTFTDWELKIHNIELKGQQGDIKIEDDKGNEETSTDVYDFNFCKGNLLPLSVTLNYTDTPNITLEHCPFGETCQMILKIYLNGTLIHTSDKFVMDKFFEIELFGWVIALIKEMFEFVDVEESNDELHFLSIWDIIPDDDFIKQRALNWQKLKPTDAYCIPQCPDDCPIEERSLELKDINGVDWWWIIIIVLIVLCLVCFFCSCCCFVIGIISRTMKSITFAEQS